MIRADFEILSNEQTAKNIYMLELRGSTEGIRPGGFINIKLNGFFLRRPLSVCDFDENGLRIIYKTIGDGTRYLSTLKKGVVLDALSGLGNGFDLACAGKSPLLIGGGMGVSPLYALAKRVGGCSAVLGFNSADEVYLKREFEAVCSNVIITTADGSMGIKGFVTDAISLTGDVSYYYACGPEPMLKAVYHEVDANGEMSFEERMACGFGVCRGCTCRTKYGAKSICKDGPVLKKGEIVW